MKSACLFPIYNSKSTQLDPDDRSGIQSLYGAKHNQNETENEVVGKCNVWPKYCMKKFSLINK